MVYIEKNIINKDKNIQRFSDGLYIKNYFYN